ncbi:uncharacterized protein LOC134475338 [Cavia porcellus]|uniref:uncharacterized protein LOC134475338 n=1 Tax=Cavia porcellus TaxID=10141 RepID=UPI002FE0E8E8
MPSQGFGSGQCGSYTAMFSKGFLWAACSKLSSASVLREEVPTTSRHIANSPDPWDVEDKSTKIYHGKVKRSPSGGREPKRFCMSYQIDTFIEGLENSFTTSAQCLRDLEQHMQEKDERQMQQEKERLAQEEEEPDMGQWEELRMLQEDLEFQPRVVPEEQQVQPHVLPLQMGAEQQASSSNEDNDSDNWEDESSSISPAEQQGAVSSSSSDSLPASPLSQTSPVRPLTDFNTEELVQLWLELPASQAACSELNNLTASDESSSQEQVAWQQQVEEHEEAAPEAEDQGSTANLPSERPFFSLRNYSLSSVLRQWDSVPHP